MVYPFLAVLALLLSLGSAQAASINVLWYTYADPLSEYRGATSGIQALAKLAPSYAESSGLSWHLTFFDNHSPTPDFSAYDVLVTESGEAFRTNAPGGPLATPDYAAILDNKTAISAARGERTFVSGTDADFHAIRGDSGNCAAFSGCGLWDGARGYLVNMVNWAASGSGLGIVALLDGEFAPLDQRWWTQPTSFLHDELAGHMQYFRDNAPLISATADAYYLNDGLSSQGLSDWRNSFHAGFVDVAGFSGTVFSSVMPGVPLSIASSAFASAATTPTPLPIGLVDDAPADLGKLLPIVRPGVTPGLAPTAVVPAATSVVPLPAALVNLLLGVSVFVVHCRRVPRTRPTREV
jgi:hypothetical protein